MEGALKWSEELEDYSEQPGLERSCSSPRWDNLPSGHQQKPLLGLKVRYMYWGQKDFFEKNETCQYMQKKEDNVLMVFFGGGFIGKKKVP